MKVNGWDSGCASGDSRIIDSTGGAPAMWVTPAWSISRQMSSARTTRRSRVFRGDQDTTGHRDREVCHEFLGAVRREVRDAVAGFEAFGPEGLREAGDLFGHLPVGERPRTIDDRRPVRMHRCRALEKT